MYLKGGLKKAYSQKHYFRERKMKKVLVILTILILVMAAVFADETRIIQLHSIVESKNPTFVLKAGLSPDTFDRESDDDNTLGWDTIEKSILTENVVVFFQIAQKGTAKKIGKEYALSIEATEMVLVLNEDGSVLAPDSVIYKTTKGSISDLSAVNPEESNVSVTLFGVTTKDTANILTEYKGKVEDGTPIATFTVTWAKDVEAPDGIYQASVILRVSPQ